MCIVVKTETEGMESKRRTIDGIDPRAGVQIFGKKKGKTENKKL